jgi:uncharacterized membrane protein
MKFLMVFLVSAVVLVEQRGAIPLGIWVYRLNPSLVFLVSYLGSLLPAPFILLLFNKIFALMKRYPRLDWFTNYVDRKIRKNTGKMEKYKELGLIFFISLPLPTTGVWTGSAVAAFLGLDFKKSMLCAAIGALISAFVITVLCVAFPELARFIVKVH